MNAPTIKAFLLSALLFGEYVIVCAQCDWPISFRLSFPISLINSLSSALISSPFSFHFSFTIFRNFFQLACFDFASLFGNIVKPHILSHRICAQSSMPKSRRGRAAQSIPSIRIEKLIFQSNAFHNYILSFECHIKRWKICTHNYVCRYIIYSQRANFTS